MAEEVVATETAEELAAREAAEAARLAQEEEARKAQLKADEGKDKKEPEVAKEGLELEGIEELEDGRVRFTWGNSVYISKEGLKGDDAIKDAWKQARDAEAAKDKAFREMKTRETLRPAAEAKTEKKTVLQPPNRTQYLMDALKAADVNPAMASWTEEQWDAYQKAGGIDEDTGQPKIKDRHITAIQTRIREAIKSAEAQYQEENINWYNSTVIDDSFENIVEILTEAGVEPDEFADIYHSVLEKVTTDKKFQNEYGYIKPGQIEKEMTREIMKTLKPKQEDAAKDAAKKELEKKHIEAERLKKQNKAPGSGNSKLTVKDKPILTLKEASARAIAAIGKGAL